MSRTLPGTAQEPLARTDNDTPDPDDRSRKKVRWNSDNLVEDDKQGDSEESTYDHKVGHPRPLMSTCPCHLTRHALRRARRFV